MKMRIVILLTLIAGLVGVQGCRTGGEWFAKSGKSARKQTFHDKETEVVPFFAVIDNTPYKRNQSQFSWD